MKAITYFTLMAILVGMAALASVFSSSAPSYAQTPVVAIDPGHGRRANGGIDPGAVNQERNLKEKDVTLSVALRVRDVLAHCPIQVYLTRESDDPAHTLYDVDELVNAQHPDLGLAIHINSHKPGSKASGVEAWYTVDGNDDVGSKRFANLLVQSISEHLHIPNRGIKPETQNRHKGLYIHWWNAPSALVELGFIQGDADLLTNRQGDYADAIAIAILKMLDISPQCMQEAAIPKPITPTLSPMGTSLPISSEEVQRQLQEAQQELEKQLREKRQELENRAEEELEKQIEKRVDSFTEKLRELCFGPAAISGLAMIFVFRKQRH